MHLGLLLLLNALCSCGVQVQRVLQSKPLVAHGPAFSKNAGPCPCVTHPDPSLKTDWHTWPSSHAPQDLSGIKFFWDTPTACF
ncbi:hypothetical protein Nmel_018246 [Mimus melanotis]